jgi:thymidylate kinase
MKQLIILEGPDAGGKSTLAEHLSEALNAWRFHATWSPSMDYGMFDYQQNILDNALERLKTQHVVLDRHWPSEWVYAGVFRTVDDIKRKRMLDLADQIRAVCGVYVLCSDTVAVQKERHNRVQDPKHPYAVGSYIEVCGRYFDWSARMTGILPVFRYSICKNGNNITDWMDGFMSDVVDRVHHPKDTSR